MLRGPEPNHKGEIQVKHFGKGEMHFGKRINYFLHLRCLYLCLFSYKQFCPQQTNIFFSSIKSIGECLMSNNLFQKKIESMEKSKLDIFLSYFVKKIPGSFPSILTFWINLFVDTVT